MKASQTQKGLSLIELSVGLVIVGLVIAGALAMYNSTSSSQRSTQLISDVQSVRATTRGLFSSQTGYGTNVNLNLAIINAKKLPSNWVTLINGNNATITAPGNIPITITGLSANSFQIDVKTVSKEICISFLTGLGPDWNSVKVGNRGEVTAFPLSPTTANTECAGASNDIALFSQ